MKVRPSVKPMCEKCKVIKRKGVVRVICSRLIWILRLYIFVRKHIFTTFINIYKD